MKGTTIAKTVARLLGFYLVCKAAYEIRLYAINKCKPHPPRLPCELQSHQSSSCPWGLTWSEAWGGLLGWARVAFQGPSTLPSRHSLRQMPRTRAESATPQQT